ncbi:hypothetical protein [Streptomyces sp. HUAS ZL42]|uniref:hypothetical protein n=1 Tax=Streptomyces sp. HUAS ZL42 TaxID=3231715 RepID=UPI00345E1F4D
MLRATTWTHGRRGAVLGASAAVLCLGGVLAACGGGGGDDGYVAVGAAGGPSPRGPAVTPTGGVRLVPLDPADGPDTSPAPEGSSPHGPDPSPGVPRTTGSAAAPDDGATPAATSGTSPSPTPTGAPTAPAGPAALSVSDPVREPTDKRWCEKVTLEFRNTGGAAVRSGTVIFGTHVIGALGIDWATIESTGELPAPIAAGATEEKTWTVCVDAWRVPLGMHVETRDVSVRWE